MNSFRSPFALLLVAVAALAAAAPARADWLVTRDGARIETRGPWKVEGRQVVFTLPNGMLSALRTEEVDLDLSAVVTAREVEAAARAAEPVPQIKRDPVLVLTEKDIPPALNPQMPVDGLEEEAAGEGEAEEESEAPAQPTSELEVISWDKTENATGDGLEIAGTLKNTGSSNITSPSLVAMIYDEEGRLLATAEGAINAGIVLAGRTANFRVSLPGVTDFAAIKFDAQGRGFKAQESAGEGGEGSGEAAPAGAEGTEEAPPES